jgi:hypothetical protein
VQEQVDDQELAGLARHRVVAARPAASADATVLGPVPAPLDCPYLHLDDDGPSCLALAPAIRLSRRQVEIVCAVAAHLSCPRLIKADAGRVPVQIDPPPVRARREERPHVQAANPAGLAAAAAALAAGYAATAQTSTHAPDAAASPVADERTAIAAQATGAAAAAVEPARTAETPVLADHVPAAVPTPQPAAPAPTGTRGLAGGASSVATPEPRGPGRLAVALSQVRASARQHITLRPATAIAWLIFVGAVVVVIAILSAGGNLTLPAVASPSAGVVVTSPSVAPASPTLVASPSPTASPSLSPSPSASPSAPATPSPSPSPSASPPFTPEQLALLKPCPGKPGCYQYRIVSGDNLRNVAAFFGVEYPALLAANPQITNPSVIHIGDRITVPPPVPPKATPKP